MARYSRNISNVTPESYVGKAFAQIQPGSVILECGSADGAMTEYLTKEMHCKVYIVEYDRESFDIAMRYAAGGICCDLMSAEWVDEFRNIAFDAVLMMDVLEHLPNPASVLQHAASMIKEDGSVIISVPNIAHNDVLMRLYNDDWRYTETGLLDKTHLRFYSLKSLPALFDGTELFPVLVDYHNVRTRMTEQRVEINSENSALYTILKGRRSGTIYQILIIAKMASYAREHQLITEFSENKGCNYATVFFADEDKAFTPAKSIRSYLPDSGKFFHICDTAEWNARYIRYDPIEGVPCIVQDLEVFAEEQKLKAVPLNGTETFYGIDFPTVDPQFLVEVPNGYRGNISIRATVFPMDTAEERKQFFDSFHFASLYYAGEDKNFTSANSVHSRLPEDGNFHKTYDIAGWNARYIRYDPVEGFPCIVQNLEIFAGKQKLEVCGFNGRATVFGMDFQTDDPQIIVDLAGISCKEITIRANIVPLETAEKRKAFFHQWQLHSGLSTLEEQVKFLEKHARFGTEVEQLKRNILEFYEISGGFSAAKRRYRKNRKQWAKGRAGQKEKWKARMIEKSSFFDGDWYCKTYPNVILANMNPALHYMRQGWKEGHDPSPAFSTDEYLELNKKVKTADICPLFHYELYGKYEGRRRSFSDQNPLPLPRPLWLRLREIWITKREIRSWPQCRIQENTILFTTYQGQYVCNPKYICNALLARDTTYDIVWLYDAHMGTETFPPGIRLVPANTPEAKREIRSAKLMIDNGRHFFPSPQLKQPGQINVCTWHGSLGFKRHVQRSRKNPQDTASMELYKTIHDYVISNSGFEDTLFLESFWPNAEIVRAGHARNDILFTRDEKVLAQIKSKVCQYFGIDEKCNILLYAPTFRDMSTKTEENAAAYENCYNLDYHAVRRALRERFGGEWVILARHHFVYRDDATPEEEIPDFVVKATDYPDMQELMVAADAGITDYSSWILDYMFTEKPAFLFTPDLEDYDENQGFYYPLEESPFPIARTSEALEKHICQYAQNIYVDRIKEFLQDKDCMEDGHACERIVKKIVEWMGNA